MERYPIRTPSTEHRGTRPGSTSSCTLRQQVVALALAALCASPVFAQQAPPRAQQAPPQAPQAPGGPVIRTQVQVPQAGAAGGAAQNGAPGGPQPAGPVADDPPVAAPFQLTPQQQLQLDAVLNEWEQRSEKITVFRCEIIRWEHDPIFGKDREGEGEIKYRAPDRGLYRVKDKATGEWIEDWRCDGKAIYEFNFAKKQLIERTLPPELQGKAIANGPLPFIFSAKAVTLKQRYFLRLVAPPEKLRGKAIAIEAYPRFQSDAANFRRAEIMLMRDSMLPYALRLEMPNGKNRTDHVFQNIKTNNPLDIVLSEFDAPRTPLIGGWKRIINPEGPPPDMEANRGTTVPTPGAPQQATLPPGGERR